MGRKLTGEPKGVRVPFITSAEQIAKIDAWQKKAHDRQQGGGNSHAC